MSDDADQALMTFDANISIDAYLDRLASGDPVPGGGAVAGVTGAQAAALISMVCALSDTSDNIASIAKDAQNARDRFMNLANADMVNFLSLMRLYQSPRGGTPADQRRQQIEDASYAAATPPLEMIVLATELVEPLQSLHAQGNRNLVSDTGIAAQLLIATINASQLNVRINLRSIRDETTRKTIADALDRAESAVAQLQSLVRTISDNL